MSQEVIAIIITAGIMLAMAVWVPCLEIFQKALRKRQALRSVNQIDPVVFVKSRQIS